MIIVDDNKYVAVYTNYDMTTQIDLSFSSFIIKYVINKITKIVIKSKTKVCNCNRDTFVKRSGIFPFKKLVMVKLPTVNTIQHRPQNTN